jgi:hypothetical protein
MADFTQSNSTIISHQSLTHPGIIEGTPVAVTGYISGTIFIKVANVETTANADGVIVIVQGSPEASGDDQWVNLTKFIGSTTAAETEALTATEPVGETVLAMASTTNLVVDDIIYVEDASVVADGEWHVITNVTTNTSIEIDYGLAVQKDSLDFVYTEANVWKYFVDCSNLARINVLIIHRAATGSDIHVEAVARFATAFE